MKLHIELRVDMNENASLGDLALALDDAKRALEARGMKARVSAVRKPEVRS